MSDVQEENKKAGEPASANDNHKPLTPEAQRALAEAEERRKQIDAYASAMPREINGKKKGLEPGRYGDWENDGITSDF